jgi:ABC-type polar amino acid transport system ATPase subunit
MNKPTLTVRNFGPLQSVDLVVDDVITLIGPQASGKSTLCKAIFLFRTIRELFERAVSERFYQSNGQLHSGQLTALVKQRFRDTFGDTPAQGPWTLQYDYANQVKCRFEAEGENGNFGLHLDERIHTALAEWVGRAAEVRNELATRSVQGIPTPAQVDDERALTSQFFEALRLAASVLFNDNADLYFIPAGRSLLTALPASVLAELTRQGQPGSGAQNALAPKQPDYLTTRYIEYVGAVRERIKGGLHEQIDQALGREPAEVARYALAHQALAIITGILRGEYRNETSGEKIYLSEGMAHVAVGFASSGQQESLWILNLILIFLLSERKVFLVIEEPEAHLFPEAQTEMVRLIVLLANQTGNQIICTTHSPYVLGSFNNHLYAHQLGQQARWAVERILPEAQWLDPDRTCAYVMEEGGIRSIKSAENQLIESAAIDSASETSLAVFDQLFALEL